MIRNLWRAFGMIINRNRIPPLPRGMLATDYKDVASEERRVMARLGARDPKGVKAAMRRYGVSTVQELVNLLEHYKPKRNMLHRFKVGVGRLMGGFDYDPHAEEIRRAMRTPTPAQKDIQQRIKRAVRKAKETKE